MIESLFGSIKDIAVFLIVLSILVIVHEWGHFITARKLGVRVEKFSVGFGRKLWSKVRGGTEFMVCLIPLGGYVKMAGDERENCSGAPDEFYSKSPGRRALIVLNGPVINFVLAYVFFVVVFLIGYPGLSTKMAHIDPEGPAYEAGLQAGDKIIAVDQRPVYGWMNLESRLEGASNAPMHVIVERDGQELAFNVVPEIAREPNLLGEIRSVRSIGIDALSNEIGDVIEGMPAEAAGIKAGDRIISIDGKEVNSWTDLQARMNESTSTTATVTLIRGDETLSKTLNVEVNETTSSDGEKTTRRQIGVVPTQEFDLYRFGLIESVRNGAEELSFITVMTYKSLWRMLTGGMSAKENMTGPVGIFFIVKGAAQEGISHILFIMAVISASLAIFNLLPVIPLDGGHLFLLAIEKIRGRALSPKVDEGIARAGLGLILLLAVFVFYSDFDRFGFFDALKNIIP